MRGAEHPEHQQPARSATDGRLGQRGGCRRVQDQPERARCHVTGLDLEVVQAHVPGPACRTTSSPRVTDRPVETSHDCVGAHRSNAIIPTPSAVA